MPRKNTPYSLYELSHKIYEATHNGLTHGKIGLRVMRAEKQGDLSMMQELAKEAGVPISEDTYEKTPPRVRKATDKQLLDAMNAAINERPNSASLGNLRKSTITDEQKIAKARELNLVPDHLDEGMWDVPVRAETPPPGPLRTKSAYKSEQYKPESAAYKPLDANILYKALARVPIPAKLNPPIVDPNNINEDPAVKKMRGRIFKEPEAADEEPHRDVRRRAETTSGRDKQRSSGIDPFVWNTPVENYPEILREPLPKAVVDEKTGERKGYIKKGIPLSAGDTSEVKNVPVWAQQMGKGISEAAIDLASTPYNGWTKRGVADLSPGELRARDMYSYENPWTATHIEEQENEIKDRIYSILESKKAYEVAKPYLKKMTENPAALHEELLGNTEKLQLKSIADEYDTELRDRLLPELKRKYMVPGLERSGHQNKDIDELIRKYSKGRTQALEQAMTKNRLGTLGIAQNYAQTQGMAGKMAGEHVASDAEREVQATNMLHQAHKQKYDVRRQFAADEERRGRLDREIIEAKLREDEARHIEAREHPYKQLGFAAEINRGLPLTNIQTTSLNALRQNPATGTNANQQLAGGLAGMAQQFMPKKKGGIINSRIKRADGGSVMQEAVQNAVIDKEDPLTALRRLMNRQRMMDIYETKIGRRRLNTGGQVNPIQKGANQAREFMGEKDLRAHIESMKTPYEKPMVNQALDSFFRGAASVGPGNNALGRMSTAWNDSAQHSDNVQLSQREQKDKAFRDTYELDQLAKQELAGLRKEERENKKFARDERLVEAKINNMRFKQQNAHNAINDLKRGEKAADLKIKLDKAIAKRDAADNLNTAAKGVSSGRIVGKAASIPLIGHGIASVLTGFKNSPSDFQKLDDASEEYFASNTPEKGRETNLQSSDRRKAKGGLDKSEEFNDRQSRENKKIAQSNINSIYSEYIKYANPEDIESYNHQYKNDVPKIDKDSKSADDAAKLAKIAELNAKLDAFK